MKELVIDRAEGNFFVCYDEHDQRQDIPRTAIEKGKPGDVVLSDNGKFYVDKELTEKRKQEIISAQEDLWE